jgi:hypothetical protein
MARIDSPFGQIILIDVGTFRARPLNLCFSRASICCARSASSTNRRPKSTAISCPFIKLPQPHHRKLNVCRLQQPPDLNLGLISVFRKSLEILLAMRRAAGGLACAATVVLTATFKNPGDFWINEVCWRGTKSTHNAGSKHPISGPVGKLDYV